MLDSLEHYSTLLLYSAMIVYAIAFVFYAVDLANRSSDTPATADKQTPEKALATVGAASTGSANAIGSGAAASGGSSRGASSSSAALARAADTTPPRSRSVRVGFSLTVVGFFMHLAAAVLRGVGAERVPWGNMYEFALTGTVAIVLTFLVLQFFVDLRFLGTLVTGLTVLFLGLTKINFYVPIVPLPPALDSYWLVIHILVAVLSVGLFTIAFGLSVLQLLQTKREASLIAGGAESLQFAAKLPAAVRLEDLAYRIAIVGFVFWSFTLIAGSIWAEAAWSRYWGWDVKEVWTFVIWVLYAGYIHARATRGWRGTRSAWLSIIAYASVLFNFTIVNVFFKGLHSYSGL